MRCGWKSPRVSTELVHPDGPAHRNDTYWVAAGRGTRFEQIAEATGAAGFSVTARDDLRATLAQALEVVRGGSSAVVNVHLAPVTAQALGPEATQGSKA